MLDGHIHIHTGPVRPEELLARMGRAGFSGGLLLSLPPPSFTGAAVGPTPRERLDNLAAWLGGHPGLYGLYWIDPTEADALEQVAEALRRNVHGFKIACDRFFPGDQRALPVYAEIARAAKPILFHSGILWDGKPSSRFNKPAEWEELLAVDGLRFSLAHVSWPWYDECIAVYGKFLNAFSLRPQLSVEMLIDLTPGTPPIYREEVLRRLFGAGYDVADNLIFGSDCSAGDYNELWARDWLARDGEIYGRLGLDEATRRKIHGGNLLRFLGLSKEAVLRRGVMPAS